MVPDITIGPRELVENDTNKTGDGNSSDTTQKTLLTLDVEDTELIKLGKKWTESWKTYWDKEEKAILEAEQYWLGKQYNSIEMQSTKRPIVDNLIFESLETFLPEATKRNAEPVVTAGNSIEGQKISRLVKITLQYLADTLKLRLKLKRQTRYWSISKLGVIKVGWSPDKAAIFTDAIRTEKLILDPDSTIDDGGVYAGEYLGEKKSAVAEKLAEMFPEKKEDITKKVDGNMGASVNYTEWWTREMLWFTMDDVVLDKYRNPHWNYDEEQMTMDEFANQIPTTIVRKNHFDAPDIPYIFLSVFNLGKHPLDDTSLILQNLSQQDEVNQLNRQIIRNVKKMNGGALFGAEAFTREEAKEAQDALDAGDGVWVPAGSVDAAMKQYSGVALPPDVFNKLVDARSELRNIFGVRGSTAQGVQEEQTVRGKIIVGQKDATRIGGGVSEYIEQCADRIFNWWVQLMFVYYDVPQWAGIMGAQKADEAIKISNTDLEAFTGKLLVSVKEGSMLPKDDITLGNQAVDLATAGLLSPIDLYTALDFPDPLQTAKNLFLWQNMPQMLFPDMANPMMGAPPVATPEQGGAPSEAPPNGQFSTENPEGALPPIQ